MSNAAADPANLKDRAVVGSRDATGFHRVDACRAGADTIGATR